MQRTELRVWAGPAQGGRWPALTPAFPASTFPGLAGSRLRCSSEHLVCIPQRRVGSLRRGLWLGMVACSTTLQRPPPTTPRMQVLRWPCLLPPRGEGFQGAQQASGAVGTVTHMVGAVSRGRPGRQSGKDPQRVQCPSGCRGMMSPKQEPRSRSGARWAVFL